MFREEKDKFKTCLKLAVMAETTISVDRPVDRGSNKRAVAGSRSTARSTETNRE